MASSPELEGLYRAERVEVLQADPGTVWRVWLSEGRGHSWAGHVVAESATAANAGLVALGLDALRQQHVAAGGVLGPEDTQSYVRMP